MGSYPPRYGKRKPKAAPTLLDGLLKQQAREVKKRTATNEPKKERAPRQKTTWRCVGCQELFTTETGKAGFEQHADRNGAGYRRIEQILAEVRDGTLLAE